MVPTSFRDAKILIVDDEPSNVLLMERLLQEAGYTQLTSTTDPRRVLALYRTLEPDLILLDLMMPHLDGIAVLRQLKAEMPDGTYVPILVLTADATLEAKRNALVAGAQDFVTKPFEQFEVLQRIRNLLDTRRLYAALEQQNRALEETVRQRTERLVQSEKVAAMGSLLAGVAHELNNPLTILSAHAQLLLKGQDSTTRRAAQIQGAAERCVRIVRNFLALARQRTPERTQAVVASMIKGAVELLGYPLRSDNVEVAVDLADDLPVLWADSHQLHQVFVNILANAHHAMRRQTRPRRITITGRYDHGGGRVRLEIADTGPGIPRELQAKIFEPFFTTKPVGEGTGLGLSLSRAIIEDHGGTIAVDSVPDHGTRFIMEFPVVAPPAVSEAATPAPLPPIRPSRVLVVDDEPEIAEVVAEAIQRDGHRTDIAAHGSMALEMLGQGTYDVIVSDTKMPVLDGEAFYAELERHFPPLQERIIFLTGDVLSSEKRQFLERTGAPFLAKPCDLDEVRRLVQRVLARADARAQC